MEGRKVDKDDITPEFKALIAKVLEEYREVLSRLAKT